MALVVRRLLDRGGAATSERADDPVPVTADRVAVGTAHRDQAAAVRAALAELGVTGVAVDTANRLQGREFDVTVVLHPLSGSDATAFHLETGSASWRPGTGTPASWCAGRGWRTCWTSTRPRSRSSSASR